MLFRTPVLLVLFAVITSVVYFWAVASIPAIARHKRVAGGALAVLLVVSLNARFILMYVPIAHLDGVFVFLGTLVMTIVISAVPIGALRGTVAIFDALRARRIREIVPARLAPTDATEMTRRQIVEAAGGSLILATTGSVLAWGTVRGRSDFEIDELVVRIKGLPRALDGYTIAQVSDLHGGWFVNEEDLVHGLSLVKNIGPDLLVATGDIVDFESRFAPMVARALSDVRGRDGVVAILGNHDYYAGASEVRKHLLAGGVRVLVNDSVRIRESDGGGFALLGLDDVVAHRFGGAGPNLDVALHGVPEDTPRILLSHQPPTIDSLNIHGRVALQLSGHTHGGQINPGFVPEKLFLKYVAGRYEVGGTTLYVNRGFGTAGPPSRVGAPPEITKVVLVSS